MTATLRRLHPPALVAFLLGLASLGLLVLTGLPALILGFRAVRRINRSDGQLRGVRLAFAGMVLGGVGTLATVVGIGALLIVQLQVASRRLETTNHMREIGLALNKYYELHQKVYPAATRDPAALPPDRRISWMADLLPMLVPEKGKKPMHLRLEQLGEQIDRARAWDDPANARVANVSIRLFLAPNHPDYDPHQTPGRTHFVGIAGIGPDAASLPRGDPRAGMFGNDRGVTDSEISRGLTYTFMALDTAHDNGPWLAGGFPTVRGIPAEGDAISGPGRPFGGISRDSVEALFVDGSVRALRNDTRGTIFRAHATLHEGKEEKN